MTLCIIPARGGSKRIPGKNVRAFAGKPMIAHSILAARASGLFEAVVVSTDDHAIAQAARDWGAQTLARPPELADDHTPTAPVLLHALDALGAQAGFACCLYATAPFVQAQDLRRGRHELEAGGAATLFPVASFPAPIFRALKRDAQGRVSMIWPEHLNTRSQDLPEAFHDAGQFYWVDVDRFRADPRLYAADSIGLSVPRQRVQDIDTPEDWETAQALFRAFAPEGPTVRPAAPVDAQRLLAWRNDPHTRAMSRNGEPVDPQAHAGWLAKALADPARVLMVAEVAGEPVGTVRFEPGEGGYEVSITLAPEARGKGLARAVLAAGRAALAQRAPQAQLWAETRTDNLASQRLFASDGFTRSEQPGRVLFRRGAA